MNTKHRYEAAPPKSSADRGLKDIVIWVGIFLLLKTNPIWATEQQISNADAVAKVKTTNAFIAPVSDYCANIIRPAADARYALQTKTLEDLQGKIAEQLSLIEELHQRNLDFEAQQQARIKTTQKAVVDIYSKMKPDIAAGQLELLDPETAVAILRQLNVRVASTILNEMKSPAAALLTAAMSDAAKNVQP